jgi:L-iditol 2-dehydrogenase
MKDKMNAVVYYAPLDIRLERVDTPKLHAGDILVKVRTATTCGTDLKTYTRGYRSSSWSPPFPIGHEYAGDVEKVGEGVVWPREGMRVSGVNSGPCFACYYCRHGQYSLCDSLFADLDGPFLGTYAEYVRIPARIARVNLFQIPGDFPYEEAALTEPLACALQGVEDCQIQMGDSVAIIGCGPLGLFFVQLVRDRGAGKVISLDINNYRLGLAKDLGADHIIDSKSLDPIKAVRELTEGRGADVVIEAAGHPETWEEAIAMTRKGGRVNLFAGPPGGSKVSIDTNRMHYDSLRLVATFHLTPSTARRAFDMITSRRINVDPILSKRMRLDEAEKALQLMRTGTALKVALRP